MRKTTMWMLFAALALPIGATEAFAHGGQYRGPGGALPPGLKEPLDPTPPSPPPPTGQPTTPTTPDGRPGKTPTPVTPDGGQPPAPATDPFRGGDTKRPTRNSSITADSWMFWYEYNKDVLQQVKRGIYKFQGSNHIFGTLSKSNAGARNASRHAIRAAVNSHIIPALLWTMNPANAKHQDTESAAYIALAKITDNPVHIELLTKGLNSKDGITRESAALALGLLRREVTDDQFDGASLDKVREVLFDMFSNDKLRARERGFAALSIGMLGDQPSGTGTASHAVATTARLFELMQANYEHPDLPVALLNAVSLQHRDTITPEHFSILRTCVTKGTLCKQKVPAYVASYAAQALGRVGDKDVDLHVLRRVLSSRRTSLNVLRSAAIAVGKLGARCTSATRLELAKELQQGVDSKKIRDLTARNFAVMSVAYLIAADVKAEETDVLGGSKIGDWLIKVTESGSFGSRPYGALALGVACRAIGEETTVRLYGEYQARAREVLRNGLRTKKNAARSRAAFAVSLGLARDSTSMSDLIEIVNDSREDDELRGYAAIGLGHIGNNQKRVLVAIRKALRERRSEKLRRATASALGMLSDREAVKVLQEELLRARSQSAKGQVVVALAKVGDERAVAPLIKLLKNVREQDLTRALACAGLGIVGDLAWTPSLSMIGRDINYRASGDMINEVLSIL